jgi:hypothetical protein
MHFPFALATSHLISGGRCFIDIMKAGCRLKQNAGPQFTIAKMNRAALATLRVLIVQRRTFVEQLYGHFNIKSYFNGFRA